MMVSIGLGIALTVGLANATPQGQGRDELDPEVLESLVESMAKTIEETYVFEDVALTIAKRLRQKLWDGTFEGADLDQLARLLTTQLRAVNNDLHLSVRRISDEDRALAARDPKELERAQLEHARKSNYGFAKVEILEGNIGYLDLRAFMPTALGSDTAVAAMGFLANADSLVIDLRQNGGGDPEMIQLLSSYFFSGPTHLNSQFWRGKEQIDQFWTLPYVPGKKLVDVPVVILTSGRTFSAAEEFTYNLKNLGRATVIGGTTGGGAHPGGTHSVGGLLNVFVPCGRAISPITGANWEGTGVVPHVPVEASDALDVALARLRAAELEN